MASLEQRSVNILEQVAQDNAIDITAWPELLKQILHQLDHVVHNDFPTLSIPLPESPQRTTQETAPLDSMPTDLPNSSQESEKENAAPSTTAMDSSPMPLRDSSQAARSVVPDSQPSLPAPPGTLPPQLMTFYNSIKQSLEANFSRSPPYTIQRLAELILRPTKHYRTLPSYLRALDRVISVSSSVDEYPLPASALGENGETNYLGSTSGPSRKAFNGATVTPIPWLKNTSDADARTETIMPRTPERTLAAESTSMIDGPNGAGSVETVTVTVNGRLSSPGPAGETGAVLETAIEESEEEQPHARGPHEIGMEDMGPQDGVRRAFDVEAAVGRQGEAERTGATEIVTHSPEKKDDEP